MEKMNENELRYAEWYLWHEFLNIMVNKYNFQVCDSRLIVLFNEYIYKYN